MGDAVTRLLSAPYGHHSKLNPDGTYTLRLYDDKRDVTVTEPTFDEAVTKALAVLEVTP